LKIPWCKPYFWGKEREYLLQAFDSTWISHGPFIDKLENQFAELHGYKHGIAVANGTCSIYLSLKALNIGPGDEVIVPGFSFIAALNMVLESGATPVLCDIDPSTMLLDVNSLEKKITKKTKAVIPVHTYGNVCEMDTIQHLSEKYGFHILEDVAEAMFSRYKNKYAGTFSEISSFSFQTTKTITTGEGGMILTNSDIHNLSLRKLRSHGMGSKKYWHEGIAYNFRLTNIQAAIGMAQFEAYPQIVEQREYLYKKYLDVFGEFSEYFQFQEYKGEVSPVVWAFPLVIKNSHFKFSRDEYLDYLESNGIEVRPAFYTPNQLPAYGGDFLKNSDFIARNGFSIPFFVGITDDEIKHIHKVIKNSL
jgi:perosamine synthetase